MIDITKNYLLKQNKVCAQIFKNLITKKIFLVFILIVIAIFIVRKNQRINEFTAIQKMIPKKQTKNNECEKSIYI